MPEHCKIMHSNWSIDKKRTFVILNARYLEKVETGATLYLSLDDACFTDFNKVFGVEIQSRFTGNSKSSFAMHGIKNRPAVSFTPNTCFLMKAEKAKILGENDCGNPVFFKAKYGKGTVYLQTIPVEQLMITEPGSFQSEENRNAWTIYAHVAELSCRRRALKQASVPERDKAHRRKRREDICPCQHKPGKNRV